MTGQCQFVWENREETKKGRDIRSCAGRGNLRTDLGACVQTGPRKGDDVKSDHQPPELIGALDSFYLYNNILYLTIEKINIWFKNMSFIARREHLQKYRGIKRIRRSCQEIIVRMSFIVQLSTYCKIIPSKKNRPVKARTCDRISHAGDTGSNPVGSTILLPIHANE